MQTDRRSLLKSLTAAGLAVSGIGWAQAATSAAGRTASAATRSAEVLAVTSSMHASALDKAFVAGVQSTNRSAVHTGLQGLDSVNGSEIKKEGEMR
ncbi:hypothetical protein [Comamonas sp. A7-5]|uniref:hypothetical protein n=1 Tax=Comamonas sp. A7-5 TaxID=673549 RepID=UPI0031E30D22